MSQFLLDTHVLLWAWMSPEKLSPIVYSILADATNVRLVSAVTAYEIANKFRLGKLSVEPTLVLDYLAHLKYFPAQELPIRSNHALLAASFMSAHSDPFDRLLASQSQAEKVPLLTADPAFQQFSIQTIW